MIYGLIYAFVVLKSILWLSFDDFSLKYASDKMFILSSIVDVSQGSNNSNPNAILKQHLAR